MANIYITLKNGERKVFLHRGRLDGSYTKTVRYEGAFVIVRDEWGTETAFPASDIEQITTTP